MKHSHLICCVVTNLFVTLTVPQPSSAQPSSAQPSSAQPATLASISYENKDYFGQPLGWDGKRVALLGRAGELNFIPANSKNDLQILSRNFSSYTPDQIRSLLTSEFFSRYDISTTTNFVVVHPWGDPNVYATPFEKFHERFIAFFESHGVALKPPVAPLIAIVLRSRNDFDRYLINEVEIHDSRIGGYYSRISNRITTYDPAAQLRKASDRWIFNASPILHEATHQSAFNTGVHNRFAPPPTWLSEGLATLFEAKGLNPVRVRQLRKHLNKGSINAALINLVANDQIFRQNPELAYALSWGLTYHLYKKHPKKYFKFLANDAKRENFAPYTSNMRLKDFVVAFGNDFENLEKELRQMFLSR